MRISFADILFLVFLVLKLTGHIDWSWWWVSAPLWASVVILIIASITAKDAPPKQSRWRQRLEEMKEKHQ